MKVKVHIRDNDEAFDLVEEMMKHQGSCALFSGDCKESVDAKSYLGVLYFMIMHPKDSYLYCETGEVPARFIEGE